MHLLSTLTYGELQEMTSPKFRMDSYHKAILPMLLLALLVAGYFAWLYYKDWQMKRKFRRYWDGKEHKGEK
jgi:vacuolar-type H+-ATPase subunit I/STV1